MVKFCITLLLAAMVARPAPAVAQNANSPFYPNWKLLKQQEKMQYIAGYLHAWRDAQKTLGIVNEFIADNPDQAAASLKRIESLYDFSTLRPETIVRELDSFYADSKNHRAPLSQAVTAARSRLR